MQPLYEYVCHMKGHRNSKGELAEWVIKSHETGKILSSHKSEQKAKEHLQQMHIFNEAAESADYPKLYHICGYMNGLTDDALRSILTTGLRIHDNGESGCIWFSTGKPFSEDIVNAQLILSLECTPENIKKYRIDEFDVRNKSGAINVHENVPMDDLNIEQLMWGRIHKGEGTRIYSLTSTKYYADFEKWQRFDKDLQAIIYEDLFNIWARDDIARRGFNPDLNRLKEIMGDRLTITNFMETKSDKLIGESTYGNNMDKRVKIFMEGVSQLGLSKNQVDAIGKITNVCMESALDDGEFGGPDVDFGETDVDFGRPDMDFGRPDMDFGETDGEFGGPDVDFGGQPPKRDAKEEHQLDQVYTELYKLGVSTDTINARGRENDFGFNTMYQLLKDVCADKGIPVPKIAGVNDYQANQFDLDEAPADF